MVSKRLSSSGPRRRVWSFARRQARRRRASAGPAAPPPASSAARARLPRRLRDHDLAPERHGQEGPVAAPGVEALDGDRLVEHGRWSSSGIAKCGEHRRLGRRLVVRPAGGAGERSAAPRRGVRGPAATPATPPAHAPCASAPRAVAAHRPAAGPPAVARDGPRGQTRLRATRRAPRSARAPAAGRRRAGVAAWRRRSAACPAARQRRGQGAPAGRAGGGTGCCPRPPAGRRPGHQGRGTSRQAGYAAPRTAPRPRGGAASWWRRRPGGATAGRSSPPARRAAPCGQPSVISTTRSSACFTSGSSVSGSIMAARMASAGFMPPAIRLAQ